MKKRIVLILILSLIAILFAGCADSGAEVQTEPETTAPPIDLPIDLNMKVALITDYGGVDDKAYNQEVYEAANAWCGKHKVDFAWYQPAGDSTYDRVEKIDQAVKDGFNVLLLPGYAFAGAIAETIDKYPDVKYVAMDVTEYDLQDARGTSSDFSWEYPENLYACVYREETGGYLAGYAAVKLGYTKLGFLAFSVPQVMRYGSGFVQGANDAAKDLGNQDEIEIRYVYHNCFCTEYIEPWAAAWFEMGTEAIFTTSGYLSLMAPSAREAGGKLITADLDAAWAGEQIGDEGLVVTSAMKNYAQTALTQLDRIASGSFEAGTKDNLGVVSENPEENFVLLSSSTQWNGGFTEADYRALVAELYSGSRTVSDETEHLPETEITVIDYGYMGHELP